MKITKEMTVGEAIRNYPESAEVLQEFGMGCVFCPSAQGESIEQAAMVHGLNLDDLLAALNK
jgi:hybrid cluster-associated redox disulfide protein